MALGWIPPVGARARECVPQGGGYTRRPQSPPLLHRRLEDPTPSEGEASVVFWWQDGAEGQGPPGRGGGLNCVPQKDTFKRVALFGDRVTADVIGEDEGPLGYSRPFFNQI